MQRGLGRIGDLDIVEAVQARYSHILTPSFFQTRQA
jgi:hypothetical protein